MAIYRGSRYINTPLYPRGNALAFGIRKRYKFDLTKATYYTVVKGDSLWKIAKTQLGDGTLWTGIYEANKAEIADPSLIYIGQELVVKK